MIAVNINKKENHTEFPIQVITNIGTQYYTLRAAKELSGKLKGIIKQLESKQTFRIEGYILLRRLYMSNLIEHAKREFLLAGYKPIEECKDGPNKWIQEGTLELLKIFGEQGHSGHSASYAINVFKTLANFGLLTPITCDEIEGVEWDNLSGRYGADDNSWQNKRCSAIFKEGKEGKPYYLNAISFRDEEGNCWGGSGALLESGERIGCAHYIKLPYTEKTFYIDVRSVEVQKDDWEMYIINPKQLDEVFQYYEKRTRLEDIPVGLPQATDGDTGCVPTE